MFIACYYGMNGGSSFFLVLVAIYYRNLFYPIVVSFVHVFLTIQDRIRGGASWGHVLVVNSIP